MAEEYVLLEPRAELSKLGPAIHGSPDYAEMRRLGIEPSTLLDFSQNINPLGPPAGIQRAIANVSWDVYPDRDSCELRELLASVHDVDPDEIVVGNGSSELIALIGLAFIRPQDKVLILGPTYSEYGRSVRIMSAMIYALNAKAEDRFQLDLRAVAEELHVVAPRLCFVCNPNNPTGIYVDPAIIQSWARAHRQSLFVVDEAYLSFASNRYSVTRDRLDNIVALRSMTKDYALAGLRLGYAVGRRSIINAIKTVQPPWSINALAQQAGVAVLGSGDYLPHALGLIRQLKQKLFVGLRDVGFDPLPSETHFFLVPVDNGEKMRHRLLLQGILVRDCASFGLPQFIRIATRRREDNARLLSSLRTLKNAPPSQECNGAFGSTPEVHHAG